MNQIRTKRLPSIRNQIPALFLLTYFFINGFTTTWCSAQNGDLSKLVEVKPKMFSFVVRSGLRIDQPNQAMPIKSPTKIYPQVALGLRHRILYVEQTRTDRITQLSGRDGKNPGFRVVEANFEEAGTKVATESLAKEPDSDTESGKYARVIEVLSQSSGLGMDIRYTSDRAIRGDRKHFGYQAENGGFRLNYRQKGEPGSTAWKVERHGDGELSITSTTSGINPCRREYRLRKNGLKRYEIAATITSTLGNSWSHLYETTLPLPIDSIETDAIEATLARSVPTPDKDGAAQNGSVVWTEGMLFLPILNPDSTVKDPKLIFNPVPNAPDVDHIAGLAIDLINLEVSVLSSLVEDLIGQVRNLENRTTQGVGDHKALPLFGKADADLILANQFVDILIDEVGPMVSRGIADTQKRLATLILQFPYDFAGESHAVSYAPGRNLLFISRLSPSWTSGKQPLYQLKVPNGIIYAMRLQNADPLALSDDEERALCCSISKTFGVPKLASAIVQTQLPPGPLAVQIGDDGSGAGNGGKPVRVLSAGIDSKGMLSINLFSAEAALPTLVKTHLQGEGLSVTINIRNVLTANEQPLIESIEIPLAIRVRTDQPFLALIKDQTVIVPILILDDKTFDDLRQDEITVEVCYAIDEPGKEVARYQATISRGDPEAFLKDVKVPTFGGDYVSTGLRYSLDGITWILAEDGLLGLYIERDQR
jgi:hypothetical protein